MRLARWLSRLASHSQDDAERDVGGLLRRAFELHNAGEHAAAQDCYRRVLAQDPEREEARRNLANLLALQGVAQQERGELDAAVESYLEALALSPGQAQVHNNLGNTYRALGRGGEAVACFRDALELDPAQPEAHLNLGIALHQEGARKEAAEHYEAALAARPDFAEASLNLGYLLEQEGDWRGAAARYRQSIAARPDDAGAHFNLALNLLAGGDFAAGWREYEWRLRLPALAPHWPFQGRPRWNGEALDGRTILLYTEQGFGDALQFVRFAPLVAARGGRVLLACQPKLRQLFAAIPGVSGVVSGDDPTPPFDVCCSLLSLPRVLGTSVDSIPAEVPYLRADPARARYWHAALAADPYVLKAGLFWATESRTSISLLRSMTLQMLAPLAQAAGVGFYSLQRGKAAREAERPPQGLKLVDLGNALADFSDDAALMANLDLVISIDSATAHLAGALGRPVWTLLAYPSEWRWLRERDDSPWYPGMRLFRQKRAGEWEPVVKEMAAALSERAGRRRPAA